MFERLREARYFPQKRALQMLTAKRAADRGAWALRALWREAARSMKEPFKPYNIYYSQSCN
jgi:hypothetical protein